MLKRCISKDWYFKTVPGDYQPIDLPHDYAIGQKRSADTGHPANGSFPDERAQYAKHLTLNPERHYVLDLDGVYMGTQVFLNEHYLAHHPYGYTPFLVELPADLVRQGTSKLVVTTNPLPNSTRWYSGNGIYRDVFLWEGGDVRIGPWDLFVSTLRADAVSADVRVRFTITSDCMADAEVRFSVLDGDRAVHEESLSIAVSAGRQDAEAVITLAHPKLWDLDTPHLYTLQTDVMENGALLDRTLTPFGVRTVTADAHSGLLLNGRPLKLRGGCIHHDHAVLGAAAFPAAEARKIRLLKEAGFNAIRTAHNPPSLALLECCDRMGMVVMDEAFDAWNKGKRPNDYHLFFEDWYARDIAFMVRRDRNHPCVFSYSIGNEIKEIDGTSQAAQWSRRLAQEVRRHDDTRLVTSGIQKIFTRLPNAETIDPEDYCHYVEDRFRPSTPEAVNAVTAGYEEPLDIIGCNYYYQTYLFEHEQYPERVIWGSETQVIHFYDSWQMTKDAPYVLGDFTWTAYDNLGESAAGRGLWARDGVCRGIELQGYPWRSCYQGDLDLCGFRRPQSYFRQAVWLGHTEPRIFVTHPEHFGEDYSGTGWHWYDVHESWTYDDVYIGRPVKAEVYTDADRIVWYVNGDPVGECVPQKGIATLVTAYRKGSITAAAIRGGQEEARYTLHTTGPAAAIRVEAEQARFAADRRDLCYFDISLTDSAGRLVTGSVHEVTCMVKGGELMGIFSGDPCNEDQYTSSRCHTFEGRALAIVRAAQPGKVGVKAYSSGLASGYAEAEAL